MPFLQIWRPSCPPSWILEKPTRGQLGTHRKFNLDISKNISRSFQLSTIFFPFQGYFWPNAPEFILFETSSSCRRRRRLCVFRPGLVFTFTLCWGWICDLGHYAVNHLCILSPVVGNFYEFMKVLDIWIKVFGDSSQPG